MDFSVLAGMGLVVVALAGGRGEQIVRSVDSPAVLSLRGDLEPAANATGVTDKGATHMTKTVKPDDDPPTNEDLIDLGPDRGANTPPATGPNVDNGLEAGVVTVDPDSAAGMAAARAREANGATVYVVPRDPGGRNSPSPKAVRVED